MCYFVEREYINTPITGKTSATCYALCTVCTHGISQELSQQQILHLANRLVFLFLLFLLGQAAVSWSAVALDSLCTFLVFNVGTVNRLFSSVLAIFKSARSHPPSITPWNHSNSRIKKERRQRQKCHVHMKRGETWKTCGWGCKAVVGLSAIRQERLCRNQPPAVLDSFRPFRCGLGSPHGRRSGRLFPVSSQTGKSSTIQAMSQAYIGLG